MRPREAVLPGGCAQAARAGPGRDEMMVLAERCACAVDTPSVAVRLGVGALFSREAVHEATGAGRRSPRRGRAAAARRLAGVARAAASFPTRARRRRAATDDVAAESGVMRYVRGPCCHGHARRPRGSRHLRPRISGGAATGDRPIERRFPAPTRAHARSRARCTT